jgi:hypothetical protein
VVGDTVDEQIQPGPQEGHQERVEYVPWLLPGELDRLHPDPPRKVDDGPEDRGIGVGMAHDLGDIPDPYLVTEVQREEALGPADAQPAGELSTHRIA